MDSKTLINIKPSHRIVAKFKAAFPSATFYGAATLGSKSKSYLIDTEIATDRKEELKQYGSISRNQPFLIVDTK